MGQEVDFSRPPPETDKLYMNIGGNDVIEVGHPPPPPEAKHWVSNTIHVFKYVFIAILHSYYVYIVATHPVSFSIIIGIG